MVKRVGTSRTKSRKVLSKGYRTKGKVALGRYFAEFKDGEKVTLKIEPSIQKGTYHIRFHGKVGVIKKKKGQSYEVEIKDGSKKKLLHVHPVHLKKV